MGNSYGSLNLFDEKVDQVNRIDRQINSFKKHLESTIKNENRVKEIRIDELNKNEDIENNKINKEFHSIENLINVIENKSKKNQAIEYNFMIEKIIADFANFKKQKEIEFNKEINILELKKVNVINSKKSEIDLRIKQLQNNVSKNDLKIQNKKKSDLSKYSKIKKKKSGTINLMNSELKKELLEDSNNKIKKLTDKMKDKIIFLLKSKSKLIDQLKKINPESPNNKIRHV